VCVRDVFSISLVCRQGIRGRWLTCGCACVIAHALSASPACQRWRTCASCASRSSSSSRRDAATHSPQRPVCDPSPALPTLQVETHHDQDVIG
jgi:hypothetical protein